LDTPGSYRFTIQIPPRTGIAQIFSTIRKGINLANLASVGHTPTQGGLFMREITVVLGALGLGAALMYLFDPDRGNRRRALIRDKMVKFNRQTQEAVSGKVTDIGNRAKGMLHEAKSAFGSDETATADQPTFS
jgi:hypothetical protein